MRKFFTIVLLLTCVASFAQKKKKGKEQVPVKTEKAEDKPGAAVPTQPAPAPVTSAPADTTPQINPLIQHFYNKYTLATRWNDLATAKDALYDLIAETSSDSLAYTLSVYYYENQQYPSAILIAKDLLARTPKNINVLQVSAASYEGLNLKDKALANYETIYLQTNNAGVLYKMAALQYDTKLYAECRINIDILLTKPEIETMKITMTEGNKNKEYPIKASILTIKGLLAVQGGDKILARKSFQDALAIAPDFTLAKENLAKLK